MTDQAHLSSLMSIEPEWIDYNGHLNMAYYNVLFDRGLDEIWTRIGFGPDYAANSGFTTYSAECHIRYLREVHQGDQVRVRFHLLDYDEKRLHLYQELIHSDGWISATAEGLSLHIDMSGPRVAPMPANILANVRAIAEKHAALPKPANIGRPIGIRRK